MERISKKVKQLERTVKSSTALIEQGQAQMTEYQKEVKQIQETLTEQEKIARQRVQGIAAQMKELAQKMGEASNKRNAAGMAIDDLKEVLEGA